MLTALAALITAFWVSICAAAPEFIWQGLQLFLHHLDLSSLLAALLIGLVLAFFVEPVMEHIRQLASGHRNAGDHGRSNALFTACLSLAFALTSVSIHEAMTAFVAAGGPTASHAGLAAGVALTIAWAIVPFTVTIAWMTVRIRWLAVPAGIIAGVSSCVTAWLFAWPVQTVITTTIPCLIILGYGYRHVLKAPLHHLLDPCARIVATVGASWLTVALLFDAAIRMIGSDRLELYDAPSFWMDVRFYVGWTVGLMLAPSPYNRPESASTRLG